MKLLRARWTWSSIAAVLFTLSACSTTPDARTDSANLGRVSLIRADPRDPHQFTIDLLHIMETGDTTMNLHVQDRDVLYVPPATPVDPKR